MSLRVLPAQASGRPGVAPLSVLGHPAVPFAWKSERSESVQTLQTVFLPMWGGGLPGAMWGADGRTLSARCSAHLHVGLRCARGQVLAAHVPGAHMPRPADELAGQTRPRAGVRSPSNRIRPAAGRPVAGGRFRAVCVLSCVHLKQQMSRNARVKINCLFFDHFKTL